ncbi:MAG: RNA-guided endonuclease InsQ/TnpB family protein [bacterium]
MRLSFKFKTGFSHKQINIVNELSWHLSKLHNIVNYQLINKETVKPVYTKIENNFKSNWHCDLLHSHNRQQLFRQLAGNWKSYFTSIKDYKKNPGKYKNKPKPPGFKNMNKNPAEIIFTKAAIRKRENKILLSLSKEIKTKYQVESLKFQLPPAVESLIKLDYLQQIRIKYDKLSQRWYLLVISRVEPDKDIDSDNIMAIDLGLNNLATLTFKNNKHSYIIDGKTIKSKNSYFNKELSRLQSVRMKQTGSKYFKDSKKIKYLRIKRRNYITNYLHKTSFKIIKIALEKEVSKIIAPGPLFKLREDGPGMTVFDLALGDIKDLKQKMKYNKSFVQIPIQRLTDLIEYKAKLAGIKVMKVNESYTSGCSALDLEEINQDNYDKSRRIKRGLFVSKTGLKINADVNGALNILRKYEKECIPELVKQARDNGVVCPPSRLRVA